ncbi:unnamed protein product, partial [Urochloa humidicola]
AAAAAISPWQQREELSSAEAKRQNPRRTLRRIMAGAAAVVSEAWGKVTGILHSQVNDKDNRANNYKIAKALGLFAGSIFFMRNCGDIMAV